MIPDDYDLWLKRNQPTATATATEGDALAVLRAAAYELDHADKDETIGDYTREIGAVLTYVDRLGTPVPTTRAKPAKPVTDVKVASAISHIESAQDQVARARRAVIAAGEDPSGLNRILNDLNRELTWLRGPAA